MKIGKLMRARAGHKGRGGWVLVFAVFTAFVALGMVGLMLLDSLTTSRTSNSDRDVTSARYLADAGVEAGERDLLAAVANFAAPPQGGTADIDGNPVTYTLKPNGPGSLIADPNGINVLAMPYEIESQATVGQTLRYGHRLINVEAIPIFQFAVFYDGDLEVEPGPSMTLSGRVHANGDMYLGCGATLTLDTNYVQAVGEIYRNRKDDPTSSPGTVRIRQWVQNPFDAAEPRSFFDMNSVSQMSSAGVSTTSGYDSNFTSGWDDNGDGDFDDPGDWYPWTAGALEYWKQPTGYAKTGNTVIASEQGAQYLATPKVGSIAMYEPKSGGDYDLDAVSGEYIKVPAGTGSYAEGYYHAKSDLSIITHANGTWTAYDRSGKDVSASLSGVVNVKSIYDARQGGNVKVTEVDMAKLDASGAFPANGLLYTSAYGMGTGTNAKGVKLVHGTELKSALTVVGEGPLYVQGDYNTVNKKGASVIGDAVNLLSNSWNDSKTKGTLPKASETTYNVAIVTGNHDTVGSSYNGGFENLPRFHENWSGVRCNIVGSFVNLWTSVIATGKWRYGGDVYQAPVRTWSYDPFFNSVANLPPFTPMAMRAREIVSW